MGKCRGEMGTACTMPLFGRSFLVGGRLGALEWLGIPDADHENGADEGERNDHPDPDFPPLFLQEVAEEETGESTGQVLDAVQETGHSGCASCAAEIHGSGTREHAVDPENPHTGESDHESRHGR